MTTSNGNVSGSHWLVGTLLKHPITMDLWKKLGLFLMKSWHFSPKDSSLMTRYTNPI